MKGIYAYVDTMDNSVVYVGKDSHIGENRRHMQHHQKSNYDGQQINRVLQNNPNRYQYKKVFVFDDINNSELNQLEMQQIALFNPKFNFTKGGEGCLGRKLSEETRRKIGEANRGKIRTEETRRKLSEAHKGYTPSLETRRKISETWKGENHPYYGKHLPLEIRKKISETLKGRKLSLETRKKMSEAKKGKSFSEETRKKLSENNAHYWKGKKFSDEMKLKISKAINTSGYYRVTKHKNKRFKQGFIWTYIYFEDGKRKELASVDLKKLEEKVKAKGLEWYKFEEVEE